MDRKIYREDSTIVKMIIDEWMICFDGIEKEILKLELHSQDIGLLNNLLEYIHSIKGGSSFIGLSDLTRLCYEIEIILHAIKNFKVTVNTELIDSLLLFLDFLKAYVVRLNEIIKEHDFTNKDGTMHMDIEYEQQGEQVRNSLELAFENCYVKVQEEEVNLEILQSEDFKSGMAEGIKEWFIIGNLEHIDKNENDLLIRLDNNFDDREVSDEIFRPVHTEQNTIAITQQEDLKTEDIKSKGSINQSIRVNQEKIDKMMNMISELLIAKNSFMHISSKLNLKYDLPEISKEVKQVGAYVNRISDELQNAIMSIRMLEIKTVFQKMPRVIRDIAQSTGKKIELSMQGENTEMDKTIIEQIGDPLVHLVRNSADHGIESPEERLSKGKPETGNIILRAYNKNKYVFIEIEDDGKGIDAESLKVKAIERGIISQNEAEKMTQKQLINLIFLPGFSMAKKITEVSGRGVGMDIVKSNIAKINGKITIESEVDKGTKMVIKLPLTLAVSRGLIVEVSDETYIVPLECIVQTVKIPIKNIHQFKGKFFTYLRGEVIRLEWLSKIFQMSERKKNEKEFNAIILSNGDENYAIVVDKLRNEQEFVVKTLEGHLASIPGISGSTLLGNGQVILIINPVELLQLEEK